MNVTELIKSAEFVTEGHKKAVLLDFTVWAKIVTLLQGLEEQQTPSQNLTGEAYEELETMDESIAGWDALSDEALLNFEAELEAHG